MHIGDQALPVIATAERHTLKGGLKMGIDRSGLRLRDLKARTPSSTRLMNVKVPIATLAAIDRLAKQLNTTKTSVVVALLNEALAVAQKRSAQ
jgi:hypothetical protein